MADRWAPCGIWCPPAKSNDGCSQLSTMNWNIFWTWISICIHISFCGLRTDLKCPMTFVNSKMIKFQILNFFLLLVVVYILYFDYSIQKIFFFILMTILGKHEVTAFWWFGQYLLFLCSDFHQIFNSISIGGNLWMILHFFHVI